MPDGQYYVGVIVAQDNGGTRGQKNRYSFHNAIVIKEGNSEGSMVYTAEAADSVTSSAVSSVISILRDIEKRNSQKSIQDDQDYMAAVNAGNMETAQRMVEEAAKAAGYTKKVYHGTPTGGFTVFRDWSYFTENKDYADRYQNASASSIRGSYETTNPMTYELGLYGKRRESLRIIY